MVEAMKNGLGRPALLRLAKNLKRAHPNFEDGNFEKACLRGLNALELKQRVAHVADQMSRFLPEDYLEALSILVRSRETWDGGEPGDSHRSFAAWPIFHFIEVRGLSHFTESLEALRDLTGLFTAEFAVRPFLALDRKRTFVEFKKWARHKDENVRRLSSEGCRPRLPWAVQVPSLIEDPSHGLALLETLKDDRSEYVRRSVGNHLNDVAKDHPDLVIDLCTSWQKNASAERRWIIERATRTLVKEGHPRVWPLLGYSPKPQIKLEALKVNPKDLKLGGSLSLEFSLLSLAKSEQKLAIDYAVHFMKADGKTRPKVFKLKVLTLAAGQSFRITKNHPVKRITTRTYYPGKQKVEILINGRSVGEIPFFLNI